MLTQERDMNKFFKNKQRGAMLMDNMIAVGFISMLLIGIVAAIPTITHKLNVSNFQKQATDISTAAVQWKKARPNFTGLSMDELCKYELISKSHCSGASAVSGSNPFGGDWTLTPTQGTFTLTATLPNLTGETGRQLDLADTMAPMTKGQCASSTGCSTIDASSADSLIMKF
ncbi:hypothetical protein ABT56_18850 [Photobacterium aquae]|uniref:Uncharacterized protein n=1 Tax=Photobacterium aquae TaxID=1195763 RepID=A0A0J1GV36_9GAMM|nr:hypothetical protein [Photobacterium aquae]KLV03496.1 hypothetical protein ABT56_18850 [Photobacterium aquae]